MKTAVLQTRIDKTLKQDADAFFESIGMDTTTAIRIFLKQTLIQRKIPFEIVQDNSFYSDNNIKAFTSVQDKFIRGTPVGKNRKAAAFVLSEKVLQTI